MTESRGSRSRGPALASFRRDRRGRAAVLRFKILTGAVTIWNVAVVLNVLGAGIGRVLAALRPAS